MSDSFVVTIRLSVSPHPVTVYRKTIERELEAGDATEHTHRPALKGLLESLDSGITATGVPVRIDRGYHCH